MVKRGSEILILDGNKFYLSKDVVDEFDGPQFGDTCCHLWACPSLQSIAIIQMHGMKRRRDEECRGDICTANMKSWMACRGVV